MKQTKKTKQPSVVVPIGFDKKTMIRLTCGELTTMSRDIWLRSPQSRQDAETLPGWELIKVKGILYLSVLAVDSSNRQTFTSEEIARVEL